jgi:hypothetical protein
LPQPGRPEAALGELARVIERDPDCVPAFHMSGRALIGQQRGEAAINILLQGIAAAKRNRLA